MRTKQEIIESLKSKDDFDMALLELLADIRDVMDSSIIVRK